MSLALVRPDIQGGERVEVFLNEFEMWKSSARCGDCWLGGPR